MEIFRPPAFDSSTPDGSSPEEETPSGDTPQPFEPTTLTDITTAKETQIGTPAGDLTRFTSGEFKEEGTMLTNIEDYAKRIREGADKYALKVQEDADLMKSEIELELAHTLIKKRQAEAEGEQIVQDAKNRHQEFVQAGTQQG